MSTCFIKPFKSGKPFLGYNLLHIPPTAFTSFHVVLTNSPSIQSHLSLLHAFSPRTFFFFFAWQAFLPYAHQHSCPLISRSAYNAQSSSTSCLGLSSVTIIPACTLLFMLSLLLECFYFSYMKKGLKIQMSSNKENTV